MAEERVEHIDISRFVEYYNVAPADIKPITSGRYRIQSPNRLFEGRVLHKAQALVRSAYTDFAAEHRFRTTQRFLQNLHQEKMVQVGNEQVFYLTDHPVGEPLQVTPRDVHMSVDNLVRLHKATRGFGDSALLRGADLGPSRAGKWTDAFTRGREVFRTERALALSEGAGGRLWADWLGRWADLAEGALNLLEESGYSDLAERAAKEGQVAFGDYRLSRLCERSNGQVWTLQLATPIQDLAIYDLATLCHDIASEGHARGVQDAVEQYAEGLPLSKEEQGVTTAFTAFPHSALTWVKHRRRHGNLEAHTDWRRRAELHHTAASTLLGRNKG